EFKGTGNSEIHLDRRVAEKRVFPAVNINRSGTRREELITSPDELQKIWILRKLLHPMDELAAIEFLIDKMKNTKTNAEFFDAMKRRTHLGVWAPSSGSEEARAADGPNDGHTNKPRRPGCDETHRRADRTALGRSAVNANCVTDRSARRASRQVYARMLGCASRIPWREDQYGAGIRHVLLDRRRMIRA